MVLAGGRVGELSVLTLERPKSALPFAAHFRIIDFPLSNLYLAGINKVGILSQYQPESLIDHIGTGESWDFQGLDRGAKILPPHHASEGGDWYRGNADAVLQNLNYLKSRNTEIALILSGDHIYSMDYRKLIHYHLEQQADMTIAFKPMARRDRRFGYGVLDETGRLTAYDEKPFQPISNLASLTIYVFNIKALTEILSGMRELDTIEFGRDVIPRMIERYRVFGYTFDGYWAYTRTVDAYFEAHQDLLAGKIDLDSWHTRTNNNDNTLMRRTPPIFRSWTKVDGSLISEGCIIEGTVIDSVLSPGVKIGRGAIVESSILFSDVDVEPGATIKNAIIDKRAHIGRNASVGLSEPTDAPDANNIAVSQQGIALIGKEVSVPADGIIPRFAAIRPGTVF